MEVEINYWAVVLAALSTMVVGSIWYTPKVFGTLWAKLARVDLNRKTSTKEMVWLFGSTVIASLVTAHVLAYTAFLSNQFFQNAFLQDTLMTAFGLWLGLTAARIYVHDAFESRRKKLTFLNVSHEFVTLMIMALIIGLMGV